MTEVGNYQPVDGPKSPITFTDAAAEKVAALITEENNPNLKLRVFITGGGCSGFQYGFTFDEEINDDDLVIKKRVKFPTTADEEQHEVGEYEEQEQQDEKVFDAANDEEEQHSGKEEGDDDSGGSGEVILLVDPMSFQYLLGAEIDYKQDLQGARFVIRNPNAKTTCGCGSSFSL